MFIWQLFMYMLYFLRITDFKSVFNLRMTSKLKEELKSDSVVAVL